MEKRRAIFLDRDGTINLNTNYVHDPREVKLLPNAVEGLRLLQQLGFLLVIVSNQSGIARGYFTMKDLKRVNDRLLELLAKEGISIAGVYFCPYHMHGTVPRYTKDSDCRKPKPGMLLQAKKDLNIDIPSSYMIGDMASDIETAANAECRAMIYVGGDKELARTKVKPDVRVKDLLEAAVWVVIREQKAKMIDDPALLGRRLRKSKKTVVSTNGVFDILHPGHLNFLKASRLLGDVLVVGLNSDTSVRRNRGPSRPINKEADRLAMLCCLESVDYVVVFKEDDPRRFLKALKPHIHVKDANYKENEVVGHDTVTAAGGRIVRLPRIGDYATSAIISRIRKPR